MSINNKCNAWVDNDRRNIPPEDVFVEMLNEWGGVTVGKRKTYKKPPHKSMPKNCWRWVNKSGERHAEQYPVAWRLINPQHHVIDGDYGDQHE